MSPTVSIGIVTWNSERDIERCIAAAREQTHRCELIVVDNASTDSTRPILERRTAAGERLLLDRNLGFSAAHNRAIARSDSDFYLALNPDVAVRPDFVAHLLSHVVPDLETGSATGKLIRADQTSRIDSTGICMTTSMRHLDRGAGELDGPRFAQPAYVFGASGAAALYRRAMLDDVRVAGEVFDEDFFAYREDADLAWRAQLLGWRCLYVPDAVATHVRRVTPERRSQLPTDINRWSVRNRFLLRLKNQTGGNLLAFLVPALFRDLQVITYVLARERSSVGGLWDVFRLMPRALAKRREIMRRRRATNAEINRWFRYEAFPRSSSQLPVANVAPGVRSVL